MYRKLHKQVFNTNPTLFVMLSITCEAQYWNRHLSVTNYCSILLCSHIHVRVYLYTSCCLYNYGEKRQDTRDKQVVLKMAPSPHREESGFWFFVAFLIWFSGGLWWPFFLILMKKMICSLAASSDNFVIQILISLIIVIFVINLGVFTTDISASHLLVWMRQF